MIKETFVVSAADITRNFGYWQQQALLHPLTITHHGRARVMLVSSDTYESNEAAAQAAPDSTGSQEQFEQLLSNMQEGFSWYDAELRLIDCNVASEAFSGLAKVHIQGKTLTEALGPEVVSVTEQIMKRVLRTGQAETVELLTAPANDRAVSMRIFPYCGGVAIAFLNITEQVLLRDAAIQWASCARALAYHTDMGWARLDPRVRIQDCSSAFQTLMGMNADADGPPTSFLDLVADADRTRVNEVLDAVLGQGQEKMLELCDRHDPRRVLKLSLTPIVRDYSIVGAMIVVSVVMTSKS